MGTLIHNVTLFTNDQSNTIIENGAVSFDNQTILETGLPADLVKRYPDFKNIDGKGKLLMPGWINAHMHCYSAFARGLAMQKSPKNFSEILQQLWWRLDKALDSEAIYYSAIIPAISAVKSGVTTFIDHQASPNCIDGSLDRIEEALSQVGLRASLCYEVSDRDGAEKAGQGINENVRFIKKCTNTSKENSRLISAMFGLHSSFTINDETLSRAVGLNKSYNAGFHIHLAEGTEDNDLKMHGMRAVERLLKYGILKKNTIAAHGIHLNDDDLNLLADSDTIVVNNPQSNMNNAVGRADIFKMMEKNILVGLGSDGMNASLYSEMRTANLIHKHDLKDPAVGWVEIQQMALKNNPEIFQRIAGQKIGKIAPGYLADLILIDYYPPTEMNSDNIWGHILFGIADAPVDTSIINGKIVMQNKTLIGIDEQEIATKSKEFARIVWEKF